MFINTEVQLHLYHSSAFIPATFDSAVFLDPTSQDLKSSLKHTLFQCLNFSNFLNLVFPEKPSCQG